MAASPQVTGQTQQLLRVFLSEPGQRRHGTELSELARLPLGTVYPILARLEQCGWLDSGWESAPAAARGRPRRRFYRLTGNGAQQAKAALAHPPRAGRWRLGWAVAPSAGGPAVSP